MATSVDQQKPYCLTCVCSQRKNTPPDTYLVTYLVHCTVSFAWLQIKQQKLEWREWFPDTNPLLLLTNSLKISRAYAANRREKRSNALLWLIKRGLCVPGGWGFFADAINNRLGTFDAAAGWILHEFFFCIARKKKRKLSVAIARQQPRTYGGRTVYLKLIRAHNFHSSSSSSIYLLLFTPF